MFFDIIIVRKNHQLNDERTIDKKVDVNVQNDYYDNVLQIASNKNHNKMTQILFDKEVNVNIQNEYYDDDLQIASIKNYKQIM